MQWEIGSRLLFFAAVLCALIFMPLEYKAAVALLVLLRYVIVAIEVRRIAQRVGERGIAWCYFIYDLLSLPGAILVRLMLLRKDKRVWR